MGDSVATEILARRDRGWIPAWFSDFDSITFCNGGMHIEHASFRISQVILRYGPFAKFYKKIANIWFFSAQIRSVLGRSDAISYREIELMWYNLQHKGGIARTPKLIRYLNDREILQKRWLDCLSSINKSVHIVWGRLDAVAPAIIAELLHKEIKGSTLTWLELGHFPMLEDPKAWSDAILGFRQ